MTACDWQSRELRTYVFNRNQHAVMSRKLGYQDEQLRKYRQAQHQLMQAHATQISQLKEECTTHLSDAKLRTTEMEALQHQISQHQLEHRIDRKSTRLNSSH